MSKQDKVIENTKRVSKSPYVLMALALLALLVPQDAQANACVSASIGLGMFGSLSASAGSCGAQGIGGALCEIVGWFVAGGIGAAVASIAVIFMGIAAFFGKVTWGMALTTACGIFAIFGAGEIVSALVGTSGGAVTQCFA